MVKNYGFNPLLQLEAGGLCRGFTSALICINTIYSKILRMERTAMALQSYQQLIKDHKNLKYKILSHYILKFVYVPLFSS